MIENILIIYLVFLNAVAFLTFGWDKSKARKSGWRIPEKTLLLLAALGGSPGAYAGMMIFHHKTKHIQFRLGIPLIFLVQMLLIYVVWDSFH